LRAEAEKNRAEVVQKPERGITAMPVATRRELLEAGVHFGHQTRRWNPKMRRYIFGERSGIYIIDLEKTLDALNETYEFLQDVGRRGGSVLFVGTKKQAQETVQDQAGRVGMPFVNTRWLGGMLTNFQTIHGRLKRLKELREMERSGAFEFLPKKEVLRLRHEKGKLERNLSGIQDMERLPEAVFVIDTKREHIAVKEARKLGIPVVAIVDTNCDPDEVDYVIPGNDDAIRSCALVTKVIADAVQEGQYLAYKGVAAQTFEPEFEPEPVAAADGAPEPGEADPRRPIHLSEEEMAFFGPTVEEGAAEAAEGAGAAAEGSIGPEGEGKVEPAAAASDAAGDTSATDVEPIMAELDSAIEPAGAGETKDRSQDEQATNETERAEA
jgi:small subunit ribosomal protein S2